ncbi:hypothetical protein [Streptomyces tendae]|uniref:hypothetical protein n=1 Tax=Streptomyces tendae TaxID=1932 RepID=UPI00248FBF42|nr:hypothetical protein [Streptomyces tendae]
MTDQTTADRHVAEARRDVHESLTLLPAWEADRVRSLIADLESAVESRTAVRMADAAPLPLPASEPRTRLLQALDASYCQALGHTPEGLLAAYEASRTQTMDRAALSAKLWEIAERHIVAEWICCEPLEPGHDLCAKGYEALGMVKSLLVDADPGEAWNPSAPLLSVLAAVLPATTNHDTDTSDARADRAAAARVRSLHQQYRFAGDDTTDYCAHCNQISGGWIPWPCPTVQALDAMLRRVADETAAAETPEPHRPVALATPCANLPADCTHSYNWHASNGDCQADGCPCRAFVPGERPEPVDPHRILGVDPGFAATTQAAALSPTERTMLGYALDQAQERIWSDDGFTDEDQAAVDSLRRLTAAQPAAGARQDGAQR